MTLEDIAELCHEANRIYCRSIGDNSQVPWSEAPEWQRDSAIKGVVFDHDNPGTTPEMLHESWGAQKIADGWVYGPVKDAEKKTHPCLVPYDQLPPEQQAKDALFKTIIMVCKRLPI
jgi:hypothetical protein